MMITKILLVYCIFVLALLAPSDVDGSRDLQKDILVQIESKNATFLSRKRRYLMFPAGSSFQLVFCLTYPSVGVGSYFVFGHTAALAFELPSMPLFFDQRDFQNKEEEPAETTTTEMPNDVDISELDHHEHDRIDSDFPSWDHPYDNIKKNMDSDLTHFRSANFKENVISTSYHNPFLPLVRNHGYSTIKSHNFVFNNKNLQDDMGFEEKTGNMKYGHVKSYSKNEGFQRYNMKNSHMSLEMDPKYYLAHRRTRRDIYKKIERFLTTLNLDGKACLLKAICEIRKSNQQKGTFVEEVFKAVFRVKPHDKYQDEDEYDEAANLDHNCNELYSTCQGSIWNFQLLIRK